MLAASYASAHTHTHTHTHKYLCHLVVFSISVYPYFSSLLVDITAVMYMHVNYLHFSKLAKLPWIGREERGERGGRGGGENRERERSWEVEQGQAHSWISWRSSAFFHIYKQFWHTQNWQPWNCCQTTKELVASLAGLAGFPQRHA